MQLNNEGWLVYKKIKVVSLNENNVLCIQSIILLSLLIKIIIQSLSINTFKIRRKDENRLVIQLL